MQCLRAMEVPGKLFPPIFTCSYDPHTFCSSSPLGRLPGVAVTMSWEVQELHRGHGGVGRPQFKVLALCLLHYVIETELLIFSEPFNSKSGTNKSVSTWLS